MSQRGFAVIDLETTGFYAKGSDRIVEVAVVHVDERGTITGKWQTLVNPQRDLGPQSVHGIRGADVLRAPVFAEVAEDLAELLANRILVAHNASFDEGFINAEFDRWGHPLDPHPEFLCTMRLAHEFLPGVGRSLADCCEACDISIGTAHQALDDAVATAELLGVYLDSAPLQQWRERLRGVSTTAQRSRRSTADARQNWTSRSTGTDDFTVDSYLTKLAARPLHEAGTAERADYLELLDRSLVDRRLAAFEVEELAELAINKGIDQRTARGWHVDYFSALAAIAWEDGALSEPEKADLLLVGRTLAIPKETIAAVLAQPSGSVLHGMVGGFALIPGDMVALTGEMQSPRQQIEAKLRDCGLEPWSGVTKKVKVLVAADTDSQSGKARKARQYGIPVIGEKTLASLLENMGA